MDSIDQLRLSVRSVKQKQDPTWWDPETIAYLVELTRNSRGPVDQSWYTAAS